MLSTTAVAAGVGLGLFGVLSIIRLRSTELEQGWVAASFSTAQQAGTVLHLVSADGTVLASFTATKAFSSLVFSSAGIAGGSTCTLYAGGSAGGDSIGGLATGGSIDGATSVGTFTAGQAPVGGLGGGMRPGG